MVYFFDEVIVLNPRSINYAIEMEKILSGLNGRTPHLLLHSCCAPCSTVCLERLTPYFDLTLFYYNPNLYPDTEYARRVEEQKRLLSVFPHQNRLDLIEGDYDPGNFYEAIHGYEEEKEGGARCKICFSLRLRHAARIGKQIGADYFTTTLTVGPKKDAYVLNPLGIKIGEEEGIPYLPSDFKKRGGFDRSTALSAEYGLYRQDYCGCIFSKKERGLL